MTKMSAGTEEQSLPSGSERGAIFTQRGRQRGRSSGLLIQGVWKWWKRWNRWNPFHRFHRFHRFHGIDLAANDE